MIMQEEPHMKSPALKAGLVGAAILLVVNLLSLIPVIGCISLTLELLAYLAIGALAGFWLTPRRETGRAAGQGALAGLLASVIGGLVRTALTPLSMRLSGGTQALLSQLPPETLQQLQQAGIDPNTLLGGGTMAGLTLLCCLPLMLLVGAGLGALGGLIFAAAKPD
jgi:hypothetical protein